MHKPVKFGAEREALVRFIEEAPPEQVVEETYRRLRTGTSAKEMLHAAALAVTRSTDLPPGHHGGPLHPVAGLHAIYHTAARLSGERSYVPIIQSVALANRHVNDPQMGPYIMPQIVPLAGGGVLQSLDDRPAGAIARGSEHLQGTGGPEETRASFFAAAERFSTYQAEHHFAWLLAHQSPVECLDTLLTVATPKNEVDDHYFIYPVFSYRALDLFGWDHADVLLRPVARYSARKPSREPEVAPFRELIAEYDLLKRPLRQRTGADETARVGALGEEIGRVSVYADIPTLLARALADGLSLEGAGEALSIGASILFCRSYYGNPMDVHMHTGVNLRRYLLGMDGLSLENKL